jgi:hypothetical protein
MYLTTIYAAVDVHSKPHVTASMSCISATNQKSVIG